MSEYKKAEQGMSVGQPSAWLPASFACRHADPKKKR